MSNSIRVDAWRTLAFGSITGSYTALGTPFGHSVRILQIVNQTDGNIGISFDGVTDNIFIAANSFVLYDATSDEDSNERLRFDQSSQLFVRSVTAPSQGAVYAMTLYGKGE